MRMRDVSVSEAAAAIDRGLNAVYDARHGSHDYGRWI